MTDGISICVKARVWLVSQTCLWNCRVETKEVAHIGLSSGCVLDSGLNPLWALSIPVHPIPWRSCNGSTPLPPSHQSPGQSHLPALTVGSSASQQLPDHAGPDNRLPCQLQVCQPWACQITVSVNSGGERVEWKEGWVNVDRRGVERAGWDVLGWRRWRECDTRSHICTDTQKRAVWHIYHSGPIFLRCWHPLTAINVPPPLFPIFLSGNSLGHISPTHLSILFLPPFLSWPHCHACSISIPQSQSSHRFD